MADCLTCGDAKRLTSNIACPICSAELSPIAVALKEGNLDQLRALIQPTKNALNLAALYGAHLQLIAHERAEAKRKERERLRQQIEVVSTRMQDVADGMSGRAAEILLVAFRQQLQAVFTEGSGSADG